MEIFDIFNNVKSGLKIILCQPNKVVFKVKVLSLRCLYPYRKPQMGRGWADIHMVKGVFIRFGFDAIRISQIQLIVKSKATETPYGMFISNLLLHLPYGKCNHGLPIIISAWGFRRCSFRQSGVMREPL